MSRRDFNLSLLLFPMFGRLLGRKSFVVRPIYQHVNGKVVKAWQTATPDDIKQGKYEVIWR